METICMKCQILFSGKNRKNINLSSAELAQRVVMVKINIPSFSAASMGNSFFTAVLKY